LGQTLFNSEKCGQLNKNYLRQVCATLLGARHVPERPCGGIVYLGRYNKCSPLPFFTTAAAAAAVIVHHPDNC